MWTRSKGVFPPSPAAQLGWGQAALEGETSLKFEVHLSRSVSPLDGTASQDERGWCQCWWTCASVCSLSSEKQPSECESATTKLAGCW